MLKKIGLTVLLICTLFCLACGSVSAADVPVDGGGGSGGGYSGLNYPFDYLTVVDDVMNLYSSDISSSKLTRDDFKYFCVIDNGNGNFSLASGRYPLNISERTDSQWGAYSLITLVNNTAGKLTDKVTSDFYPTSIFGFSVDKDKVFSKSEIQQYITASIVKDRNEVIYRYYHSAVASLTRPVVAYSNHDIRYANTDDFFLVPSLTLGEMAAIPLGELTRGFSENSLTILKVGLIIFASLLAVYLIRRWANWAIY